MEYNKFKEGLKNFIRKEPVYIFLAIIIILINLMTFFSDIKKDGLPSGKPTMAKELILRRAELRSAIFEDERISKVAAIVTIGIASFMVLGLFLDFVIFIRKMDNKDLLKRSLSPPQVDWSIWDGLKVIILFPFFGYLLLIIEAVFAPVLSYLKANKSILPIVNTSVMDLIGIAIIFYFALVSYKHRLKDLGLSLKNFLRNVCYGILGYISVLPALTATLLVTIIFVNLFRYEPKPQQILELFMEEKKPLALIYISIFVSILGPIMEEIFFRGFLYNAIKKETSVRGALFVSAVLFSSFHVHIIGFLPIFILGVFLAYLYEKTGSLIPSITLHIMHNMIMVFFVFLIKGIRF